MSYGGMSMRRSSIDDHGQAMVCMLPCTTQVASSYMACKLCLCALSARVDTPDIRHESVWSHHHANQHGQDIGPCHIMYTHALLSLSRPHRSSPILLSTLGGRAHGGIISMSTPAIEHCLRDSHATDFAPAWPWYSTTKPTMCTIELRTSSADGSVIVQAPSPVWPACVVSAFPACWCDTGGREKNRIAAQPQVPQGTVGGSPCPTF